MWTCGPPPRLASLARYLAADHDLAASRGGTPRLAIPADRAEGPSVLRPGAVEESAARLIPAGRSPARGPAAVPTFPGVRPPASRAGPEVLAPRP